MDIQTVLIVKTKGEAQSIAIDWQRWQSNQVLSYDDVIKHEYYFHTLGKKFHLIREFKENGII